MAVLRRRTPKETVVSKGTEKKRTLADALKQVDTIQARVTELTPGTKAPYSVVAADIAAVLVARGFMAPST